MDETIYKVSLMIIMLWELIFGIPLVIDSLMGKDSFIYVIFLLVYHVAMYMYGTLFRLESFKKRIHVLGIIAFFGSFIPLIGFFMHLVTSISVFKENRKLMMGE